MCGPESNLYDKFYVIKKSNIEFMDFTARTFLQTLTKDNENRYYVVNQDEWWSFIVKWCIKIFCKAQ